MKHQTLYEKIAQTIQRQIEQGTLKIGDRIPSVRHMSQREKVSISTVLQSYIILEQRGLIESHPQSGFYVRNFTRNLPPEPEMQVIKPRAMAVQINDLVCEILETANNTSMVQLGASGPSQELFPHHRLNRILHAVIRECPNHSGVYHYPPGFKKLRQQVARRAPEAGCLLGAEEIVITNGAMEAINLSLRGVAGTGDTVAVESPTHFSILQTIENLGMKALEIPTHPRTGIDLDRMEWALEHRDITAGVFMANFSNPIGSLMSDDSKKKLVELFNQCNIPIIEDDIEGDLAHSGERPKALKHYDKKGLVLWCSSFSKTLSPGLRVGWVAPGKYQKTIQRLKYMSSMASASLSELVLARYLEEGGYERHLRKLQLAYAGQISKSHEAISKYFPAGTKATRPQGGFVLWLEFPKSFDGMQLYQRALAHKISILPGFIYSASDHFQNYIRLNCGQLWSDRVEKAYATLGKLIAEQI